MALSEDFLLSSGKKLKDATENEILKESKKQRSMANALMKEAKATGVLKSEEISALLLHGRRLAIFSISRIGRQNGLKLGEWDGNL
jgi:hypothetical protein